MTFIQKAIGQGVAILFGATGEIRQFKSWNPGYHVYGRYFRSDGGILL